MKVKDIIDILNGKNPEHYVFYTKIDENTIGLFTTAQMPKEGEGVQMPKDDINKRKLN